MTSTYLDAIGEWHRERSSRDERVWGERMVSPYTGSPLSVALRGDNPNVAVIAEIKRRSPSKGWLNEHLDAVALSRSYEESGASALSVLTDREHFGAHEDDLPLVAANVSLPCLRKDFTVSENDVLDAREMGAAAVLLIVALLQDHELVTYRQLALSLGMEALVEVHTSLEAQRALDSGATIIGVNQRNLHTFDVEPRHAATVISSLPSSTIRVAESGLRTPQDVEVASEAGFDAVLVGESFVSSQSPALMVRSFSTVSRRPTVQ